MDGQAIAAPALLCPECVHPFMQPLDTSSGFQSWCSSGITGCTATFFLSLWPVFAKGDEYICGVRGTLVQSYQFCLWSHNL